MYLSKLVLEKHDLLLCCAMLRMNMGHHQDRILIRYVFSILCVRPFPNRYRRPLLGNHLRDIHIW